MSRQGEDTGDALRLVRRLETMVKNGDSQGLLETVRKRMADVPQDRLPWVLDLLSSLDASVDRDLLRAKVHAALGQGEKALEVLVAWLYPNSEQPEGFGKSGNADVDRLRVIEGIKEFSASQDQDLHLVLRGELPEKPHDRAGLLRKLIYFSGDEVDLPVGELVFAELKRLANQRTLAGLDSSKFCIEFPKMYSSSTPVSFPHGKASVGGGYFMALGGYGCVVDPGYNFLENFFEMGHSLNHINGIIVTHFHDDHYASLPALLSLLFKRHRKAASDKGHSSTGIGQQRVDVFLDRVTHQRFQNLVDPANSPYLAEPRVLTGEDPEEFPLGPNATVVPLPTHHALFSGGETNTGFGLAVFVPRREACLIISGDTRWTKEVEVAYSRIPRARHQILVAHVSTCDRREVPHLGGGGSGFCSNHLGVHGLAKAIEATGANAVLLSEVGEELRDVRGRFVKHLRNVYEAGGVKVCDWAQMDRCYRYPI